MYVPGPERINYQGTASFPGGQINQFGQPQPFNGVVGGAGLGQLNGYGQVQQMNSTPEAPLNFAIASVALSTNGLRYMRAHRNEAYNAIDGVPMFESLTEFMTQPCRIICCCCFPCYWMAKSGSCPRCMRCCCCGEKRPYTGTLLHWAVYYGRLDALRELVELGANLDVRMKNGQTPLMYAKSIRAQPEIIAYLEKAKTRGAPTPDEMQREGNRVIEKMAKMKKHFACFLSHHKRDAAAVATLFRVSLSSSLHLDSSYVFLDTEDLRDLRSLRDAVKSSLVLVLLLTKDVLTRPWCLAEIYTAIENNIPIVSVKLEGQGNTYDFEQSLAFLKQSNFREALENANPGAPRELETQGIDIARMQSAIASILPYILSKKYDVSDTERIRNAQMEEIAKVILEKV
jgi:hypothetical protein